jgi:hypothetical protein
LASLVGSAFAHKPSDSYLKLAIEASEVSVIRGQWDIALRDLDYALGLDADGDAAITWGELRRRHAEIAAYALAHLTIEAEHTACAYTTRDHLVDHHSDGAYAVLRFEVSCPEPLADLNIRYRLFFDLDPQHKGLLNLSRAGQTDSLVFSADADARRIEFAGSGRLNQFANYAREGVWHILIGYDHILFLLSLLLPAVLKRDGNRWQALACFRDALVEVIKVVTAFTLAHSVTLSLAALQVIALPTRWVESAIAASVVLAALNNLFPLIDGRRWLAAFAFGLVHGLGFANVLKDLGLPSDSLLVSLVAFNLGVEAGQIAVVGVFLPIAYRVRHSWSYQGLILRAGSVLIALVACVWLLERSLDFKL